MLENSDKNLQITWNPYTGKMFFGMALILLLVAVVLLFQLCGNILRINRVPMIDQLGQLRTYVDPR